MFQFMQTHVCLNVIIILIQLTQIFEPQCISDIALISTKPFLLNLQFAAELNSLRTD